MEGRLRNAQEAVFFAKSKFPSDILGYNSETMNEESMKTW